LLHFLLNRDLTNVDIRKYPETTGNAKQKLQTNPLLAFLVEKLGEGKWFFDDTEWRTEIPRPKLLEEYRNWLAASNYPRFTGGQDRFTDALAKILPLGFPKAVRPWKGENRESIWYLKMPGWEVFKAHLETVLGVPLHVEPLVSDMSWTRLGHDMDMTLGEIMSQV
jgi:hypothetical protein